MSQITTFGSGGGGGGTVITITGNTGGAVGPDGGGNIDLVGSGDITVTGTPESNTLTISSSGGGSGITTIDGDTGSVTGTTVAFNGQPQAGGSVNFSGSGTTMLLNTTDGLGNTFVGLGCGNTTVSFDNNAGYGLGSLASVSNGQGNTAIGAASMGSLVSGNFNTGLGQAFQSLASGDRNIALGYGSGIFLNGGSDNFIVGSYPISGGANYTSTESANICIANEGVTGESGVTRIGTNGTIGSCYIAGINGVNLSTATLVTESADRLGTTVLTAGTNITITPGSGTLTIAATGGSTPVSFLASSTVTQSNVTGGTSGAFANAEYTTVIVNNGGA